MSRQPIVTEGTFVSEIKEVNGETVTTLALKETRSDYTMIWEAEYLTAHADDGIRILLHKPTKKADQETPATKTWD